MGGSRKVCRTWAGAWETSGYDADNDGRVDVDLKAMGASPDHKDVFVEMDYMARFRPAPATLARIVQVFATAPVSNPDGRSGIALHLDAGAAVPGYDLGGGGQIANSNLDPVDAKLAAIRRTSFASARAGIFHYMVWGNTFNGEDSSGYSPGIPGDTFVVTLGEASNTQDQQVGTFVHELGHNLGLEHGGDDGRNNKPNYLSVMNYSFQFGGVPKVSGPSYFGYSAIAPTLNEQSLVESVGVGASAAGFLTAYYCPGESSDDGDPTHVARATGPIDWNCNGRTRDTARADITGDGWFTRLLTSRNDWQTLVYDGGAVGGPGSRAGRAERGPVEPDVARVADAQRKLVDGVRHWRRHHQHHAHPHRITAPR